jgi:HlyD family secretion protein
MKRSAAILLVLGACARDATTEKPGEEKAAPRTAEGIHLEAAAQERLGIVVAMLELRATKPLVRAYGRVVADPSQGFELRAPIAGVLRAEGEWPAVGAHRESADLGWIEPRLSPTERTDLAAREAQAQQSLAEAEADLEIAKKELERARVLNAEEKSVSDRVVEEADARAKSDEAKREGARRALEVVQGALSGRASVAYRLRLAETAEVTEILARPGEQVDAGAVLLRTARFDPALVRVELPIGESIERPERATVVAASRLDRTLEATFVAVAPTSETQGTALLFRVSAPDPGLRPGQAVTAWIERGGDPVSGLLVPRSAVVRHAGKTWIYVRKDAETFEREELRTDRALPEGWLASLREPTASGTQAPIQVAVEGAQSLLSTELLGSAGEGGADE